jgi:5-methylcytosine-specific restriction protein A
VPKRPPRPCKHPGCSQLSYTGYCDRHAPAEPVSVSAPRQSAARRGYNRRWQRIRARVLAAAGIPQRDWPLYDVDHRPPYDPELEPDHSKYELVPMLRAEHSRKTARENGGFGNPPRGEGRVKSLAGTRVDRGGEASSDNVSKGHKG